MTMEQGYVQVYTGDGKGKTTAAVGLAMRAAAANLRVCFCQFMKCGPTGELDAFRLFGEANVADSLGYFGPDALVDLVLERPENVELVVTGRGASDTLTAVADLVTEMREVKHYYEEGVLARRGIEF